MVQLVEVPHRERMFHGEYAYYSSSGSRAMREHFAEFAKDVLRDVQGMDDPFILEIGGNDGVLLQHVAAAGVRHLRHHLVAPPSMLLTNSESGFVLQHFAQTFDGAAVLSAPAKRVARPAQTISIASLSSGVSRSS
jgi:hypothetical protein